jgi:hypothetical protein
MGLWLGRIGRMGRIIMGLWDYDWNNGTMGRTTHCASGASCPLPPTPCPLPPAPCTLHPAPCPLHPASAPCHSKKVRAFSCLSWLKTFLDVLYLSPFLPVRTQ